MRSKPVVGMLVRLNDEGMQAINGLKSLAQVQAAQRMKITSVGNESLTNDVDTWMIEVDQPEINKFMISNHDVDSL